MLLGCGASVADEGVSHGQLAIGQSQGTVHAGAGAEGHRVIAGDDGSLGDVHLVGLEVAEQDVIHGDVVVQDYVVAQDVVLRRALDVDVADGLALLTNSLYEFLKYLNIIITF